MAFCSNCGSNISDEATFCASCGQPVGGANAQKQYQYQGYAPKPTAYIPETDEQDIRDNSTLSLFCYLSIFGIILALVAKPESKYVKFHANQGICMNIFIMILSLCAIIPFLGWVAAGVGYIFTGVCAIMGIVRACNGRMVPLPIFGKYNVLNYK